MEYVNEQGPNRYLGYPAQLKEHSLLGLDRTVWHLRRHCFTRQPGAGFAADVAALKSEPLEHRLEFKIPGGRLEKILAKQSDKRRQLVWKNFWFGTRRRRRIAKFPGRMAWRRPIHLKRPEV